MNELEWTTEMALGIPDIDASHRRLLLKLHEALFAQESEFALRFHALIEEFEHDIRAEEVMMEAMKFYDIKMHREQHARALQALHDAVPDILRGDFAKARKTLELFPKWLQFHSSTMDTLAALWFKLKKTDTTLEPDYQALHKKRASGIVRPRL